MPVPAPLGVSSLGGPRVGFLSLETFYECTSKRALGLCSLRFDTSAGSAPSFVTFQVKVAVSLCRFSSF